LIVTCGEAIIDLVSTNGLDYRAHFGGTAMNVAVAGARLGGQFALLARTSVDGFGVQLRSWMEENGVVTHMVVPAQESTTLAIAMPAPDGSASYAFYLKDTADWQWHPSELPRELGSVANALHVGSMALEVAPGAQVLHKFISDEDEFDDVTIMFDPNCRLAEGAPGASSAEKVVRLADIVKVSVEDIDRLYPGCSPAEVAQGWSEMGPSLVCLTAGEAGASVFRSSGEVLSVDARRVHVLDTIGAGDTFSAALLCGLDSVNALGIQPRSRLQGLTSDVLRKIAVHACRVASITCERLGADSPNSAEVLSTVGTLGIP
jgi:fructokinase